MRLAARLEDDTSDSIILIVAGAKRIDCGCGGSRAKTRFIDWTYLTTQNEQGSYSGGAYAFATFAYLNTSQSNSHYHEEGWDSTYSSYVSDNASHYYSIYTVAGAGTTGTYTDHSDGWSSDYFYGTRWDGGVDSDSNYDSYVYDDTGETGIDSAAYPPAPIFHLPSPRASVRAYLAAVDSYFAGYHGPHAVGRGPNALGHTRNIHGDRENGLAFEITSSAAGAAVSSASGSLAALQAKPGQPQGLESPQSNEGGSSEAGQPQNEITATDGQLPKGAASTGLPTPRMDRFGKRGSQYTHVDPPNSGSQPKASDFAPAPSTVGNPSPSVNEPDPPYLSEEPGAYNNVGGLLLQFVGLQITENASVGWLNLIGKEIYRAGTLVRNSVGVDNETVKKNVSGLVAGDLTGVTDLENAANTTDSLDGHEQSLGERGLKLVTGTFQIILTAFGIKGLFTGAADLATSATTGGSKAVKQAAEALPAAPAEAASEAATATVAQGEVGTYTTKIKWGVQDVEARPAGPGFWGERTPQSQPRVDAFELKVNPNNESYYLPHPQGGYVQFENAQGSTLQDGKLVVDAKSFYKPSSLGQKMQPIAERKILAEAQRQVEAASAQNLQVEWLVSDKSAVAELRALFKAHGINITVTPFPE